MVHREVAVVEQFRVIDVIGGTQAGDAGRHVEQGLGDPAGAQVGLVRLGNGDEQVGVLRPGGIEDRRGGRIAGDDPQIEAFLQGVETLHIVVHDGDVVGLGNEALGDRSPDLSCAQNDDFHGVVQPGRGTASRLVLGLWNCREGGQEFVSSWRRPTLMPSCLSLR